MRLKTRWAPCALIVLLAGCAFGPSRPADEVTHEVYANRLMADKMAVASVSINTLHTIYARRGTQSF